MRNSNQTPLMTGQMTTQGYEARQRMIEDQRASERERRLGAFAAAHPLPLDPDYRRFVELQLAQNRYFEPVAPAPEAPTPDTEALIRAGYEINAVREAARNQTFYDFLAGQPATATERFEGRMETPPIIRWRLWKQEPGQPRESVALFYEEGGAEDVRDGVVVVGEERYYVTREQTPGRRVYPETGPNSRENWELRDTQRDWVNRFFGNPPRVELRRTEQVHADMDRAAVAGIDRAATIDPVYRTMMQTPTPEHTFYADEVTTQPAVPDYFTVNP